jgi:colicin import membrane protein
LILILLGFFHNEYTNRPVLSKPIEVSLISIEEAPVKKTQIEPAKKTKKEVMSQSVKVIDKKITPINSQENKIEKSILIEQTININELLQEDAEALNNDENSKINEFSLAIIKTIEAAWIKPKNIQDGLVCDLKIRINKNGRILSVDLVKSSGNIRFDNSAIKAVNRVETFNFFDRLDISIYQDNFRNVTLTFNPQ